MRLIVSKVPRNVGNPWRHILKDEEYLVASPLIGGLDMNVENIRADSSVRGFGALAPHPGRHREISCELAEGCWEGIPSPTLCLPEEYHVCLPISEKRYQGSSRNVWISWFATRSLLRAWLVDGCSGARKKSWCSRNKLGSLGGHAATEKKSQSPCSVHGVRLDKHVESN